MTSAIKTFIEENKKIQTYDVCGEYDHYIGKTKDGDYVLTSEYEKALDALSVAVNKLDRILTFKECGCAKDIPCNHESHIDLKIRVDFMEDEAKDALADISKRLGVG